jgi:transketolase
VLLQTLLPGGAARQQDHVSFKPLKLLRIRLPAGLARALPCVDKRTYRADKQPATTASLLKLEERSDDDWTWAGLHARTRGNAMLKAVIPKITNHGVSVPGHGFGYEPHLVSYREMANAIRALTMDAVECAQSGHPGMPMGMADVATVLYARYLKFDPNDSKWPDRDRFVLSAGHGSMLLYSLLHLTRYSEMTAEELQRFRQLGSKTPGHPEYGHTRGVETTTGPLGQGLANAVGMALAERMLAARYGDELVDHYTYVMAGDGCLMEGISHEAISLAGQLQLHKLIAFFDDNHISIDGPTSLSCSDDHLERFVACGWSVKQIDGHDHEQIAHAIDAARNCHRPSLIACRTRIGYGAPKKEGTCEAHGAPLGAAEIQAARQNLGWSAPPFVVPELVWRAWSAVGERGHKVRVGWENRLAAAAPEIKEKFLRDLEGQLSQEFGSAIRKFKETAASSAAQATRTSSQKVLDQLVTTQLNLVGGSADLTASNNTKAAGMKPVHREDFSGRYIHYGVREHAMAAAMNGMALHGGFIPYGGTFLAFSDYCRPAIRLSALMRLRVVHVMTHDSIGLGEDGPTHQPVEHLAALRAIPNLQVIRPADAVETAEAWEVALLSAHTPTVLCLSRQSLPALRTSHTDGNRVSRGAYVLRHAHGPRRATLIATGSEVMLAMDAAKALEAGGIGTAVVSMPCFELFAVQPEEYRSRVLGEGLRIGVEAGIGQGWERWLGANGGFVGMSGFGASGPARELYKSFGITVEDIVGAVQSGLDPSRAPAQSESVAEAY